MYIVCFSSGATVDVFCDSDRKFQGLFLQDRSMREMFKAFPELLCMDATYKLLNLGFPLYLFLAEGDNI